ncbi:DUF6270 domain-containing protein [Glutamicibacter ardleyensis]|uniref:Uncharacterized protein n=1 Tax=Glutamicibacter ardleyensis TaxID=225894 RepID=A0ABQ2DKE5_9MICC|nr:DUF6270 domain-containing protein [Glutamicibacter ardleyensis]GGJ60936.1 hypothetical protein GCM10007173_19650 [Glutamicibacter ardleyensis]
MANFLIYGGCVSRDTFELVKDEHTLLAYVARQSLISASSKPETRINMRGLSAQFNSRMVKGDIQSNLLPTIRKVADDVDVFLFDILSERLGVFRLSGGTYITNSAELKKSELMESSAVAKASVPMGTEIHFNLWKNAANTFKKSLVDLGIFDKTYLIKSAWTDETVQGSATPRYRNWSSEKGNSLYEPYFEHLRELGFQMIVPPAEVSKSTEDHKWGPAPYHYQSEFYDFIVSALSLK